MKSILSTFLNFYVFHLFLSIQQITSECCSQIWKNIATKDTGKAFAETNNYFNFFVEKSQWLGKHPAM